ncbi:uncharacterized protein YALI1_D24490g [Yarrowia lipolytica]|uniref:Uncharacterized protein n=1 Tax=Yarrowia lipolytica TaxID=4952 RepID=A0A1D8NF96_YARLL|nr:hypothetical protein YALI1_D24490g [Yarrowia lipolytica]
MADRLVTIPSPSNRRCCCFSSSQFGCLLPVTAKRNVTASEHAGVRASASDVCGVVRYDCRYCTGAVRYRIVSARQDYCM